MNWKESQEKLKNDALEKSVSNSDTKYYVIWNTSGDWGFVDTFPYDDEETTGNVWICYYQDGEEFYP
jgi:hypothetical protein